jgi:hypothetical protein
MELPTQITRATIMRPREGGPDRVYLHCDHLPSPTSTTKRGLDLIFTAFGGTAERYLQDVFGLSAEKILVKQVDRR